MLHMTPNIHVNHTKHTKPSYSDVNTKFIEHRLNNKHSQQSQINQKDHTKEKQIYNTRERNSTE